LGQRRGNLFDFAHNTENSYQTGQDDC
jgi:hypothetical protein